MARKKAEATAEKKMNDTHRSDIITGVVGLTIVALIGFVSGFATSDAIRAKHIGIASKTPISLETRMTCLEDGHDWEFRGMTPNSGIDVWEFHCKRCGRTEYKGESQMTDAFWRIAERQTGLERPQPYNRITTIYRFK